MGMDMLVKLLFRTMGVEPEAAWANIQKLQLWLIESVKSFDNRFKSQEARISQLQNDNAAILAKLDQLLNHYGVNENERFEQHSLAIVRASAIANDTIGNRQAD